MLHVEDDVCFVLDQHAKLNFYSARNKTTDRHVTPLKTHIIPIPSQPVSALIT
jgi:hypothetical protein